MVMRLKELNLLKWLGTIFLVLAFLSCSDKDDPTPEPEENNLVEASVTGTWPVAQLKLLIQLSGQDIDPNLLQYDVDIYKVTYKTAYKDSEIHASGLVLLPRTTGTAMPMIGFQHGTIVKQADAPSVQQKESEQVTSYSALASMGFITVVPDMIGFGASKDIFHPYYVEEPTARAVTDMLHAAVALAKEKQLQFDSRVFLAGYSQGGYGTLATHKALEAEPQEGFEVIASFPGAGGYDVKAMQDYLFGLSTYSDPYYIAYVAMSYESYYGNDNIVDNFFDEPYASKIPTLFDGFNSGSQINEQLVDKVPALMKDDVLQNINTDPKYQFLREDFQENSLVDWAPSAPVYFYHGDADITVPLENTQLTYDKLISNGASPDDIHIVVFPGGDHNTSVAPYIVAVVKKLQELK